MILPTKRLPPERCLLAIGADLISLLDEPKTVSRLWQDYQKLRRRRVSPAKPGARLKADHDAAVGVKFDWFVLALDFLYLIRAVTLDGTRVSIASGERMQFQSTAHHSNMPTRP